MAVQALKAAAAVLRRPQLWPAALALVPPRWWRRWPPWPLPSRSYLRFRMETMYGDGGRLEPADLVRYLEWVRTMRRRPR
jgi:hypothetical protein